MLPVFRCSIWRGYEPALKFNLTAFISMLNSTTFSVINYKLLTTVQFGKVNRLPAIFIAQFDETLSTAKRVLALITLLS